MIRSLLWDVGCLCFACGAAPRLLWQALRFSKKYPPLKSRLGCYPPKGLGRGIWIHAVSVGEMKAAKPLVDALLAKEPQLELLLTTATVTGREEAKRLFGQHCAIRYLPLDFSFVMRRWIRSFKPEMLIFIEGDLWPNLLRQAKRYGVKTALLSGKISERSAKRFSRIRWAARQIFGALDLISAQNEEHRSRLASLVQKPIEIGGNLKLDLEAPSVDPEAIRKRFALSSKQIVISIACTHRPEEKELLESLRPLWVSHPDLVVFLAPRHPERFEEAAAAIRDLQLPFCRWNDARQKESVVLVDAMGQLPLCYAVSRLAILAGSFSSKTGGHNVLEPCLFGCPVFFGPYMQAQAELASLVQGAGVGRQVATPSELPGAIRQCLGDPSRSREHVKRAVFSPSRVASKALASLEKLAPFLFKKEKDLG